MDELIYQTQGTMIGIAILMFIGALAFCAFLLSEKHPIEE